MNALPKDIDDFLMAGVPVALLKPVRERLAYLASLLSTEASVEPAQTLWLGVGNLADLLEAGSAGAIIERPDHFFVRSHAEVALARGSKTRCPFLPGLLALRPAQDPLSRIHDEVAALVIGGGIHIARTWGHNIGATLTTVTNACRAVEQLAHPANSNLLASFPSLLRPLHVLQALLGHDVRKAHLFEPFKDEIDVANWLATGSRSEPRKQLSALIGKLKFGRAPIYAPNRGAGVTRVRKAGAGDGTPTLDQDPTPPLILRSPLPKGPRAFLAPSEFDLPPLLVRNDTKFFDPEISDDCTPKVESPPSARKRIQSKSLKIHRSQARAMARDMARRGLHLPCEAALPTAEEARDLVETLIKLRVGLGPSLPGDEGYAYLWLTLCLGSRPSDLRFQPTGQGLALEGFVRLNKGEWAYCRGVSLPSLVYSREMTSLLRGNLKRMLTLPLPWQAAVAVERLMQGSSDQTGFELVDRDALARDALKFLNSKSGRNWTLARVASILPSILHQIGADRAQVAWILGERPMDAPPTHYSQLTIARILKTYRDCLEQILPSQFTTAKVSESSVGSTIILRKKALAAFLQFISKAPELIDASGPDDFARHHNCLAIQCYLILALATGHRPVKSPFERIHDFDLDSGWLVINDKAIGRASARLVPLAPTAVSYARKWQDYLRQVSEAQILSRPAVAKRAAEALSGAQPFFFLLDGDKLTELTPKAVQEIMHPTLPLPANWTRHAVSTALRESGLDADVIDACLGHDGLGVGHQSRHSALSHQKLQAFSSAIENWFQNLGFSKG